MMNSMNGLTPLALAWFLLSSGTVAGMCAPNYLVLCPEPYRQMPNASQPRCYAGEVGGEVCVIEVYATPQSDLDGDEQEHQKLSVDLRRLDDDDDPEPFPIPAPGVGKISYISTMGGAQ